MKFCKMHGCGNDFIVVNCISNTFTKEEEADLQKRAPKLCNRKDGIGADGLILIKASSVGDFSMEIINADGSIAEMCGNGIRCVGKYVYDNGLKKNAKLCIETRAGIKYLDLQIKDEAVEAVCVNMGSPMIRPEEIPVLQKENLTEIIGYSVKIEEQYYSLTCVSMGNPHTVLFVNNIAEFDVAYVGKKIECHKMFPRKTNVEFVQVLNQHSIAMRVWERGAGETLACGTGACASVVACALNGYTGEQVEVHLLGGKLLIQYDRQNQTVYMTGPAVTVYHGEIILP